jgi:hypothetical protein
MELKLKPSILMFSGILYPAFYFLLYLWLASVSNYTDLPKNIIGSFLLITLFVSVIQLIYTRLFMKIRIDEEAKIYRLLFSPIVVLSDTVTLIKKKNGTEYLLIGKCRFDEADIRNWDELIVFIETAQKAKAIYIIRRPEQPFTAGRIFIIVLLNLLIFGAIAGLLFALLYLYPKNPKDDWIIRIILLCILALISSVVISVIENKTAKQ